MRRASDLIANEVIPSLGPSLFPELRQQFDLQGKSTDARRLESPLQNRTGRRSRQCRQVLTEGSKELKARRARNARRPRSDRSGKWLESGQKTDKQFRAAAFRSLAHSTKEEALDALLKGILDTQEMAIHAHAAMKTTPHPRRRHGSSRSSKKSWRRGKRSKTRRNRRKPPQVQPKENPSSRSANSSWPRPRSTFTGCWSCWRAGDDPKKLSRLLPLLQHKDTDTHVAALQALAATRDPQALAAIVPLIDDGKDAIWQAAIWAMVFLPPEQHFDTLPRWPEAV